VLDTLIVIFTLTLYQDHTQLTFFEEINFMLHRLS